MSVESQEIGWGHEGTPETDAINDGSALYWKIGVKTTDLRASHPQHIVDYRPLYNSATLYPSDSERVHTRGMGGWVYHTLGGTSNIVGPADHQPWITVRSQMTGKTDSKYISAKGAKVSSVGTNINFLSDWKYMTETMTYNAIKTEAADHAAAYTPVYPTDDYLMNGTPVTSRYCWGADSTNEVFTWNSLNFKTNFCLPLGLSVGMCQKSGTTLKPAPSGL
jgi:hypothetical protein